MVRRYLIDGEKHEAENEHAEESVDDGIGDDDPVHDFILLVVEAARARTRAMRRGEAIGNALQEAQASCVREGEVTGREQANGDIKGMPNHN